MEMNKTIITRPTDKRLGRLQEFDERNFNHLVRTAIPKKYKPRGYTWKVPLWLNQGSEGSCVGFSFAHELAARPAKIDWLKAKDATKIYKVAQTLDQWPGENYEGTSILGGIKAVMQLYPKAYESYKWAYSIDDAVKALGYFGPVVLGVNWYQKMFSTHEDGFIKVGGRISGGHAILAYAVNVKEEFVTLRNSWGSSWGVNGDAKLSFKDLERLLKEGGECCVPVGRKLIKR